MAGAKFGDRRNLCVVQNAARARRRTPGLRPPIQAGVTRVFNNGNYFLLESIMSKLEKARTLPRSLYHWSFVVLLPLLVLVVSACGNGGGLGY